MKKIILLNLFFAIYTMSFATIRTVSTNATLDVDFTDLPSAISASAVGDTLKVYGSNVPFAALTLDKKIIFLGPGYFLTNNDTTQVNTPPANIAGITFAAGSEYSIMSGISFTNKVTINADNISLTNCYIAKTTSIYYHLGVPVSLLYVNGNSCSITKSFIRNLHSGYYNTSYRTLAVEVNPARTGFIFKNNIIKTDPNYFERRISLICLASSVVENNIFYGTISVSNAIFINNIQVRGNYTDPHATNISKNNLHHSTQFGTTNGNQQNIDMSLTFEDMNGYVDRNFLLKTGSPAIGAGFTGIDCGVFGSSSGNEYALSGMNILPSVFEAIVPFTVDIGSPLNVTIKGASHNGSKSWDK